MLTALELRKMYQSDKNHSFPIFSGREENLKTKKRIIPVKSIIGTSFVGESAAAARLLIVVRKSCLFAQSCFLASTDISHSLFIDLNDQLGSLQIGTKFISKVILVFFYNVSKLS